MSPTSALSACAHVHVHVHVINIPNLLSDANSQHAMLPPPHTDSSPVFHSISLHPAKVLAHLEGNLILIPPPEFFFAHLQFFPFIPPFTPIPQPSFRSTCKTICCCVLCVTYQGRPGASSNTNASLHKQAAAQNKTWIRAKSEGGGGGGGGGARSRTI